MGYFEKWRRVSLKSGTGAKKHGRMHLPKKPLAVQRQTALFSRVATQDVRPFCFAGSGLRLTALRVRVIIENVPFRDGGETAGLEARDGFWETAPYRLMNVVHYQHRQFGTVTVWALGLGALLCLSLGNARQPGSDIELGIAALLIFVAYLFSSLTIEVTDTTLRWWFGPGFWRKQVPLAEIANAQPARTTVIEGWGVHFTRRGWLYNVSGFGAVAIHLKSGRRFVLGTNEPDRLASVLRERSAVC